MSYVTARVSVAASTATLVLASDTVDRFVYLNALSLGTPGFAYNSTDVVANSYPLSPAEGASGFVLAAGLELWAYNTSAFTPCLLVTPVPAARLTLGC